MHMSSPTRRPAPKPLQAGMPTGFLNVLTLGLVRYPWPPEDTLSSVNPVRYESLVLPLLAVVHEGKMEKETQNWKWAKGPTPGSIGSTFGEGV